MCTTRDMVAPSHGGLLNLIGASQKLNVSPYTLYKWVSQRRIPFIKLGSRLMFSESALDEWIEGLLHRPAGPPA
jgi:excisionase family DNA binding protein